MMAHIPMEKLTKISASWTSSSKVGMRVLLGRILELKAQSITQFFARISVTKLKMPGQWT